MREAVIVSTARTPLTKSHRGEFNITPGPTLAAFAIEAAVERAKIDPALIEDAILGCGYPEGTTGKNVARHAVVRAGLPLSIAGTTVNRFCGSGLQAINFAAFGVQSGDQMLTVGGGVESMSRVPLGADGAGIDGNNLELRKKIVQVPQGISGDLIATREGFTRENVARKSSKSV